MTTMQKVQELIDQTANTILDEWTAEAQAAGIDTDTFIADKLDEMEETEPAVVATVGQAHLRRMFAA